MDFSRDEASFAFYSHPDYFKKALIALGADSALIMKLGIDELVKMAAESLGLVDAHGDSCIYLALTDLAPIKFAAKRVKDESNDELDQWDITVRSLISR